MISGTGFSIHGIHVLLHLSTRYILLIQDKLPTIIRLLTFDTNPLARTKYTARGLIVLQYYRYRFGVVN